MQHVGLLLVHLCHLLGQVGGVLVVAHAAVRDTGHAHALLLCLLRQILTKLHPLLRRQAIQGGHGRLLVLLGGQLRGDLLVAIQHLLVGVPLGRMPLVVAVDKVLVVLLLLAAQNVLQEVHHFLSLWNGESRMTLPRCGRRAEACLLALVAQARTICVDALIYSTSSLRTLPLTVCASVAVVLPVRTLSMTRTSLETTGSSERDTKGIGWQVLCHVHLAAALCTCRSGDHPLLAEGTCWGAPARCARTVPKAVILCSAPQGMPILTMAAQSAHCPLTPTGGDGPTRRWRQPLALE